MKGCIPVEKRREALNLKGALYDWLDSIVFALIIVMIFNLGFRLVNVSGDSMLPTLHNGDRLVITQIGYQPQYGDIIVSVQDSTVEEAIIKRVIAVEGQTVDIDMDAGVVLVDGKVLEEDYIAEPILQTVPAQISFPVTVPQEQVFVLGDNRNNSLDSRSAEIGMIEERYILGKVLFRLFPLDQLGAVA